MKPIRVGLLRGWYLNPWEMQRYEPLQKEFDITAISTHHSLFDLSEIQLKIKKFHWPGESFYFLGKTSAQLINRGLYKYVRYNQWMFGLTHFLKNFDIIHAADTHHLFSLQAARAKKKYGSKLLLTVWENIPFQDRKRNIFRRISKEVIENTDFFLPVTNRSREMLLLEGIREERIKVILQPVNLQQFKPTVKNKKLLRELNCEENQPIILFIGRLHPTKGVQYLLFALKRLIEDSQIINLPRLIIVGTGERKKEIVEQIHELKLTQNVVICGTISHNELVDYYGIADVFVLPSVPSEEWQEQFGMVLVEAMACGKPIISTLTGSIPDVLGDAGILIPPADFYSLYQSLKKLLLSSDLQERYKAKARYRAESLFHPTTIANQTAEIYHQLHSGSI